jgi:hypothetical protein
MQHITAHSHTNHPQIEQSAPNPNSTPGLVPSPPSLTAPAPHRISGPAPSIAMPLYSAHGIHSLSDSPHCPSKDTRYQPDILLYPASAAWCVCVCACVPSTIRASIELAQHFYSLTTPRTALPCRHRIAWNRTWQQQQDGLAHGCTYNQDFQLAKPLTITIDSHFLGKSTWY